jgi:hypothetical protein
VWGGGGTGPRSQQGRRGKPANIIVKFFFFFLFFRIFIYNFEGEGEAGVTEVSRLRAPPPSHPQQSPSSRFTSLKYYYKYYEIRQG